MRKQSNIIGLLHAKMVEREVKPIYEGCWIRQEAKRGKEKVPRWLAA